MDFLINIAVFFILLKIAVYLIIFQRLIGFTLQYPAYAIKESENIPDYIENIFQSAISQLQQFQFEFCHYLDINSIFAGNKKIGILLYNPNYESYLTLSIAFPPNKNVPINLTCYSFFQDNTCLITFNGEGDSLLGKMPDTIIQNIYAVTLEEQWQTHIRKLQEISQKPQTFSPAEFTAKLQLHSKRYIDSLVSLKQLIKKDNQYFYVAISEALKTAVKIMKYSGKKAALVKKQNQQINSSFVIPIELEEQAFWRLKSIKEIKPRKEVSQGIFALSLLAFILGGHYFWGIEYTLTIALVIFLHELGHFFAMKCYGYQNTSIFFLPLFGAATVGRKENTTINEEVLVLLAGPISGLLLGFILLFFTPELKQFFIYFATSAQLNLSVKELMNISEDFIDLLLMINWLNLLPIYPLDGGKVIHTLFFNRYPYLDVFFKIITVLLLLTLSTISSVFLILGILTALTIFPGFRQVKVLRTLKQNQNFPKNEFHRLAFSAVKTAGYDALSFEKKAELIERLEKTYYQPASTWVDKSVLSFFYLLFLIGSLVAIFILRFNFMTM
jgi:Zn-dependent protease